MDYVDVKFKIPASTTQKNFGFKFPVLKGSDGKVDLNSLITMVTDVDKETNEFLTCFIENGLETFQKSSISVLIIFFNFVMQGKFPQINLIVAVTDFHIRKTNALFHPAIGLAPVTMRIQTRFADIKFIFRLF